MKTVIALAYLIAAVLFILGLKQLSSPKSARNGNFIAAAGMVIALIATIPLLNFTTVMGSRVLVSLYALRLGAQRQAQRVPHRDRGRRGRRV